MIALLVMAFIALIVLVELLASVLPLLVVLTWVPPEDRSALAAVMAAADHSRRLTFWSALRLVIARRERR